MLSSSFKSYFWLTFISFVGFLDIHVLNQLKCLKIIIHTNFNISFVIVDKSYQPPLLKILYPRFAIIIFVYALAVSTVQPFGIPLIPVTFHVAAEFLTNVPVEATLFTHSPVLPSLGVVVNIAFM